MEACASSSRPSKKVGGKAVVRPPNLRWIGAPQLQHLAKAPVAGKVIGLDVDDERTAGGRA
jgi:hypothetical protein